MDLPSPPAPYNSTTAGLGNKSGIMYSLLKSSCSNLAIDMVSDCPSY